MWCWFFHRKHWFLVKTHSAEKWKFLAKDLKYTIRKHVAVSHWIVMRIISVPTHFPGQQISHCFTSLRTPWEHLTLQHHGSCSLTEKFGPDQGRGTWGTKNTIPIRSYCALSLGTFVGFRYFLLLHILKYAMESKHFLEGWKSPFAKYLNILSESHVSGNISTKLHRGFVKKIPLKTLLSWWWVLSCLQNKQL